MTALGNWVVRHRLVVGLLWLVITIAGLALAPSVSGRLISGVHVNSPANTANVQIAKRYGGADHPPGLLTIDLPAGQKVDSPAVKANLRTLDSEVAKAMPTLRVASYASTGDRALIGSAGDSTLMLVYSPQSGRDVSPQVLDKLKSTAEAAVPGATVHATGVNALSSGNPSSSSHSSSVLIELLTGALAALIVLAWVFGSFLAFLPLIMALISVLTMQLFIYGLTYVVPSSIPFNPAVQYIVALLGLGLSIDYSLLIVNRWREERTAGRSNAEAVAAAMQRAGHAVVLSGITASLGLFALIVVPVSLVQGIGIAGLFIPSTATVVALTLLPAVLSKVGPRVDWPRPRSARRVSRFWTGWSRLVIRHRIAAAVLGLGILIGLTGVAATINISQPTGSALAGTGPYADGLHALRADGFGAGALTTVPIYVPSASQAQAVVAALSNVPSVRGAVAPAGPAWHQGGSTMVLAIPTHEIGTSQGGTSLADIRRTVPSGVLVGGDPAQKIDEVNSTYGAFPLMFCLVATVTFLLLARGLRSLLLPAKAVLLNALSVAATYGMIVLVFQHGYGSHALWGISATGSIDTFVPLLMFGFLFGISMDYEVFILSRVREGYDRTGDTHGSIVEGVSHTGRLVTSAALILFFAFASLTTTNDITVRELAAGLAGGVILDAVIVRMLLLPALVSLLGTANWWMPDWAARLLRLPRRKVAEPTRRTPIRVPLGDA
ncbi:MMPL family transporter [Kribbella sp.]|uniref:MMPL family transporter n=1 Tax=Kribbella sp. TaxID=1871183 RepID=UPI002D52A370|nr:MMPL family transporter [Kribbella sp.]HZX04287.1 MMPL family transporter [Kribbella sp.]